jgi:hypothetical protein
VIIVIYGGMVIVVSIGRKVAKAALGTAIQPVD